MAELNEAQALLRDTARRALAGYPEDLDLGRGDGLPAGAGQAVMALAAEQGWSAICVPEEAGGLGLGLAEAALLAHEIGRSLAPGPFLSFALLPALARAAQAEWLQDLSASSLAGERRVAVGLDAGTGSANGDILIAHAEEATDILVLSPRTSGGTRILWLASGAAQSRQPLDPTCPIGALPRTAFEKALDTAEVATELDELLLPAHLWIAAELTGIAERAGEIAVSYAKERRQFGSPIGAYQAVKHRIVDDFILTENARTLVAAASAAFDAGESDASAQIHAARAAATEAALAATAGCIQIHGAAGFSWEHPAHLYLKRARRLASSFGDAQASRAIVARHLIDHGGRRES